MNPHNTPPPTSTPSNTPPPTSSAHLQANPPFRRADTTIVGGGSFEAMSNLLLPDNKTLSAPSLTFLARQQTKDKDYFDKTAEEIANDPNISSETSKVLLEELLDEEVATINAGKLQKPRLAPPFAEPAVASTPNPYEFRPIQTPVTP